MKNHSKPLLLGFLFAALFTSPLLPQGGAAAAYEAIPPGKVKLLPGLFKTRQELNRRYMVSLRNDNLLQNFYQEAGLWSPQFRHVDPTGPEAGNDIHWGWESPTCQLRGHFLGHWLSAAAYAWASTGDAELKGKADAIVAELARCQFENGGQWVGSIPTTYLDWIARGKSVWAPHYTLHKTLMGLVDMYSVGGNLQAFKVLENFAAWFHTWSGRFDRQKFNDILDYETGGMLEAWADLYGITHQQKHLELLHRYDRPRLFDRLLAGEDPLTNHHANTTIPEAQGAARAFEVTHDNRWKEIALAYWKSAVTDRGCYCTGGQTSGEVWSPPHALSARLSDTTQEHCVVYNMIRLADYLLRWTGDPTFGDYIERNLYNGILAQQNPQNGMVAYFLPLRAGGRKVWSTPTNDFWCCVGSLVQAQTRHERYIYYQSGKTLLVNQYIPSELDWAADGQPVKVRLQIDPEASYRNVHQGDDPGHRPNRLVVKLEVDSAAQTEFTVRLRVPWWVAGSPDVSINGSPVPASELQNAGGIVEIRRIWASDTVRIVFPKQLKVCPLPDAPGTVAFMDGPVVLAGLVDSEQALEADLSKPESVLVPDNEREWAVWLGGYRTAGQDRNLRFIPLYEVVDQPYTVYFPIQPVE